MVSENIEEYLECIWEITQLGKPAKTSDIAAELKVSPASVTEMVQKLAEEGFVVYEKYKRGNAHRGREPDRFQDQTSASTVGKVPGGHSWRQ